MVKKGLPVLKNKPVTVASIEPSFEEMQQPLIHERQDLAQTASTAELGADA